MRLVLQRVSRASVRVGDETVAAIGNGLLALVGVGRGETSDGIDWLASKVAGLRVFEDGEGRMNLALGDVGGEILLVPQFTLYADVRKGRRPSWDAAAPPDEAAPWVVALAEALERMGVPVRQSAFREHMAVELVNDGPVTILVESPPHR